MKEIKYALLGMLAAFTLLAGCSKDEPEKKKSLSDECGFTSVGFRPTDNPTLSGSATAVEANGYYFVTVSEGADITQLHPSFKNLSDKAKVLYKGQELQEGQMLDFTNVVTLTVTSESGAKKKTVKLCVRNGQAYCDNLVYKFMGTYSIPGVGIAVMRGEDIVYSAGCGFAITEIEKKATADHLFRLGSVSKQFTTLCIMKLMEEGRLDIDDHVFGTGGILDAQFPGVTGKKATITVRNFLQHNSGFPVSPDPMFTYDIRTGKTIDDLIRYILNQDLIHEPGSTYAYYNMGFGVLGRVVEVVSGKKFEDYMRDDVLAPMGVTDIHVGGDRQHKRDNECVYYMQGGTAGYANPMDVIYAAGGIIASANELMEVLRHIDGRSGVPDTFLPSTLDLMYNSPTSNYNRYSLGWRINHSLFPNGHYHSGNLAGTSAFWVGGAYGNMSGCVICNSRSYITNPDFDSAYYILMSELIQHFK